ncbi:MAG: thiol reductase thioredoxin [Aphanocapsa feldmannii 277cV]|uniref:Thioredoxin n=1 Tax=Aphanocapsa feldmannii 277cV TaxID=2507553 RepID=A0A524RQA8_9CHRO|nr:MAG: thiol reductase thioredoxin [Aphanocapsa feldmannii 288cV]TGG94617.1 MAG: thiol reductase thioredoxin [Aphanocapsa feldmannii 277cV]
MAVVELTDQSFPSTVLESTRPVLVDFYASWCGPCRLMAPMMTWADETYGERLLVTKMDVDANPATRDAYRLQGIPCLVIFRNSEEVARSEGALSQGQLRTFIDPNL